MLSQYYEDPLHPADDPDAPRWKMPVATAYGINYKYHASDDADWCLCQLDIGAHQIEASKLDPRVVYIGKEYNKPPAQFLAAFASRLDPEETYIFVGQVLAKLAETEPWFMHG